MGELQLLNVCPRFLGSHFEQLDPLLSVWIDMCPIWRHVVLLCLFWFPEPFGIHILGFHNLLALSFPAALEVEPPPGLAQRDEPLGGAAVELCLLLPEFGLGQLLQRRLGPGSVKLKGIIVIGGEEDSHPSKMRL